MREESQILPSGVVVHRTFDDDGRLAKESYGVGMLEIALVRELLPGPANEQYFYKRRLVGRPRYEKVRLEYPDMPAADVALEDVWGDLAKEAAAEQRALRKAAQQRQPDAAAAAKADEFCLERMREGRTEDAGPWLAAGEHSLGERTPKDSRRLVQKLLELGCPQVHACNIRSEDEGFENAGHLVVELPSKQEPRKKVFQYLARLAAQLGFDGDFDDGQRFAFLMLD